MPQYENLMHTSVGPDQLVGSLWVLAPDLSRVACQRGCSSSGPLPSSLFSIPVPTLPSFSASPQWKSLESSDEGLAASALPSSGMDRDPRCFSGCLSLLSGLLAPVNKARPWEADSQAWGLQLFIELLCTPAALGEQTQPGKFLALGLCPYYRGPRRHSQLFAWSVRPSPGLGVYSVMFPFISGFLMMKGNKQGLGNSKHPGIKYLYLAQEKAGFGGGDKIWVQIPPLPPISCVTLSKWLNLSGPQLFCKMGITFRASWRLSWAVDEMTYAEALCTLPGPQWH